MWISAHWDISGKVFADLFNKFGSETEFLISEHDVGLPLLVIKDFIINLLLFSHQNSWSFKIILFSLLNLSWQECDKRAHGFYMLVMSSKCGYYWFYTGLTGVWKKQGFDVWKRICDIEKFSISFLRRDWVLRAQWTLRSKATL